MTVTWSAATENKGTVKYSTDNALRRIQQVAGKFSADAKIYVYTGTLTDLKPATTYYYQCGSDRQGGSKVYAFKTAPVWGSQDKFVVGVFNNPLLVNLFEKMVVKAPILIKIEEMLPHSNHLATIDGEKFVTEYMVQWYGKQV